jgi:hypothetical protein
MGHNMYPEQRQIASDHALVEDHADVLPGCMTQKQHAVTPRQT